MTSGVCGHRQLAETLANEITHTDLQQKPGFDQSMYCAQHALPKSSGRQCPLHVYNVLLHAHCTVHQLDGPYRYGKLATFVGRLLTAFATVDRLRPIMVKFFQDHNWENKSPSYSQPFHSVRLDPNTRKAG